MKTCFLADALNENPIRMVTQILWEQGWSNRDAPTQIKGRGSYTVDDSTRQFRTLKFSGAGATRYDIGPWNSHSFLMKFIENEIESLKEHGITDEEAPQLISLWLTLDRIKSNEPLIKSQRGWGEAVSYAMY